MPGLKAIAAPLDDDTMKQASPFAITTFLAKMLDGDQSADELMSSVALQLPDKMQRKVQLSCLPLKTLIPSYNPSRQESLHTADCEVLWPAGWASHPT